MATISIKNLASSIYESSLGKSEDQLNAVVENAVSLISKKHLMSKSKEILIELEKILDKNEEVIRAQISSRSKINQKTIDEIEDFIKKRYKVKNIVLEFIVDEKLLGGIKIKVGDEIIDGTLKNKIKKLENHLIIN